MAGQHGVEPRLVMAIIKVESGFDAKAVSSAGASGLMQLMPGTQRHLGVRDAFNPDENVEGGGGAISDPCWIGTAGTFRWLWRRTMPGRQRGQVRRHPPFEETRNYVRKVLALYATP